MRRLGYIGRDAEGVHEWCCDRNEIHMELHDELIHNSASAIESQKSFFNHFMPYLHGNEIDWSFHFLYLLIHLRQHFMNYGVGFRQFMDLGIIIQNDPGLKWDWIVDKLEENKLLPFAYACFSLVKSWFNIDTPISYKNLSPLFLEKVTQIIMNNGVFGYDNEDNRSNEASTTFILSNKPRWIEQIRIVKKGIFLPYQAMKGYSGCGYLVGRPYLLPFAWIHRFVMIIKRKGWKSVYRSISSSFVSKDKIEERKDVLMKMGLIELE